MENNQAKLEQAKQKMRQSFSSKNVKPEQIIKIGQMAENAIKDPNMYQILMEQLKKSGLVNPALADSGHQSGMLASLVSAGKLAQMIQREG